jgi:hypothetical protein
LFEIGSLPGTFCVSTESDQYFLCSGSDGSVIGAIGGLTRGLLTEEGHFFPSTGDSDIQLMQVSGSTLRFFRVLEPTDVVSAEPTSVPGTFRDVRSYPNPFNASTTIEFSLSRRSTIEVAISNVLGQRVTTLIDNASMSSGTHRLVWDGRDSSGRPVSSGHYFFTLSTSSDQFVHKLLLIK